MQSLEGCFDSIGGLAGRGADVDDRVCLLGDDVRAAPAGYEADVDADAARQILDPLDRGDLRGQLMNRARPFSWIHSRMRGDAVDRQLELSAPLARRLERTARHRRL